VTVLLGLTLVLVPIGAACQSAVAPTPTTTAATPAAAVPPTQVPAPAAAPPPAAGTGRIDVLNAADAAFATGDLTTAAGLYERVLNTPTTGETAPDTSAINQYAHFRAIVTLLADGREDDAKGQVDALQQADASAPFSRLAAQLWDQYGMVGSVRGACAQVQPQIATQAGPILTNLRSEGLNIDPSMVCGVPPTAG